jgi:hypothetical protein
MTRLKHDTAELLAGADELDAVIDDYKRRVQAGEVTPRGKPLRLPYWPRIRASDGELSDRERRRIAKNCVLTWVGRLREHFHQYPGQVRAVSQETVIKRYRAEYGTHSGEDELPVWSIQAFLKGIWPESVGPPEAPTSDQRASGKSAEATAEKPNRSRRGWVPGDGPFTLVKRDRAQPRQ